MSDFNNTRILITGAASGIGRLMAETFAREGAHLVLWDINQAGLDAVEDACAALPGTVATYPCDLTDREAIYATARQVLDEHGAIDILINNAGVVSGKPLLEIPDEHIERTFAVNTLALFWTTRAFMPAMIEQGRGHIVTIASSGGLAATSRMTDYCSSKFAAFGFDEALRMECKRLGFPIRTTVVCPFYIHTGMFEGVKTRFPWILPILKPEYAVRRIVTAIRKKKRRLIMPRFVYTTFPSRLLPVGLSDAILEFFGVNKTMDEFIGRSGRSG